VDTVSSLELFGEPSSRSNWNFRVVSIHPDRNVAFFVVSGLEAHTNTTINRELISYDMGHKEVSLVVTFENETRHRHVVPYATLFRRVPGAHKYALKVCAPGMDQLGSFFNSVELHLLFMPGCIPSHALLELMSQSS
jgi:hypothetical protein